MQDDSQIKCPYYVTKSRSEKKMATITCDNMEKRLGFDVKNQLLFVSHKEKEDYCDIFCKDQFENCPYYEGIYGREGKK